MRISDWSSDVCSSDLSIANAANLALLDSGNRRVRLTVYNTAGGAAAAAQRALAEGNRLFLGPLLAPDVRAIQGMSRAANVPILTFSNDASLAGGGTYVLGLDRQSTRLNSSH